MFSSAIINNYERYSEVFNCQFLQVDNAISCDPEIPGLPLPTGSGDTFIVRRGLPPRLLGLIY